MSISCPLCVNLRRQAAGLVRQIRAAAACELCNGDRQILWSQVQPISDQMQRVADAMQAGDDERAAAEGRRAAHLALAILSSQVWHDPRPVPCTAA